MLIKNTVFSNNKLGGSAFSSSDNVGVRFDNCHFINNENTQSSTACIRIPSSQAHSITNCIFRDNRSIFNAGALHIITDNGASATVGQNYF